MLIFFYKKSAYWIWRPNVKAADFYMMLIRYSLIVHGDQRLTTCLVEGPLLDLGRGFLFCCMKVSLKASDSITTMTFNFHRLVVRLGPPCPKWGWGSFALTVFELVALRVLNIRQETSKLNANVLELIPTVSKAMVWPEKKHQYTATTCIVIRPKAVILLQ